MDEKLVQAVVRQCMADGVIIGMKNRSLPGMNNTLCFSPALSINADEVKQIMDTLDRALTTVFG